MTDNASYVFRDFQLCCECNRDITRFKRKITVLEEATKGNIFRYFCNWKHLEIWLERTDYLRRNYKQVKVIES